VAYHSAKRVTNDLAFNQTMQKKFVLPRNQNVVDLMQLASRAYARHCEQFVGNPAPWRVCARLASYDSFRK